MSRERAPAGLARVVFNTMLAFFLLVAVARLNMVLVPALAVIPVAKIAAVVLAITGYVALSREDALRVWRTPMGKAFAVISVLVVLSAPFAVWPTGAIKGIQSSFLPVAFLFVIGSIGLADRRTLQFCTAALVLAVGADALIVLLGRNAVEGRAFIGGGYDPNDSAALLVATIPLALLLVGQRGIIRKIVYGTIALLCLAALVKTGSRGGLVGLVAMFGALVAVSRGGQRVRYVLFVAVAGLLFSALARDQLRERFASVLEVNADYNLHEEDGRIEVWKRGMGYMIRSPLVGVGFHNFTEAEGRLSSKAQDSNRRKGVRYTAAHSAYVEIGAELGVFGLCAFFTLLGGAGLGCWRIARRQGADAASPEIVAWARAAFVALVGLSVSAIFLSLAYHPMLVFGVTLCTGVIVYAARERDLAAAGSWTAQRAAPPTPTGWRSRRSVAPRATRAVPPRPAHRARGWRSA
jgi:O-antigen ligase